MRRILALVLSVAMVLILPVFAFAASPTSPDLNTGMYSNGTSVTTSTAADGTVTTTTTVDGDIDTVDVEVSQAAAATDAAIETPAVLAVEDPAKGVQITITVPAGEEALIEIPVTNDSSRAVVMKKNADGTYSVVKMTADTEKGVAIKAEGEATYVVVNNDLDYTDVPAGWQQEAADFVSSHELMLGTGAETFSPEKPITAAQMMTVLARLDDGVTTEASTGSNWAAAGTAWAQANGYSASGEMTRTQMAKLLYKYAGSPAASATALDGFADAEGLAADDAAALAWCVENGIIGGTGAGKLSPNGVANRIQLATILMRYINTIVK